jgi:type VI secretion system protein VasG
MLMVPVNLKSLISRLNDTCRRTLEGAAGLCLSRTNYNVEIEHWLVKLLEEPNTDLAAILKQYDVDITRLNADLSRALDRLKTGNARPPALSPNVTELAREGWVLASVEHGEPLTRSSHLLCALLADESQSLVAREASQEFEKINPTSLLAEFPNFITKTSEANVAHTATAAGGRDGGPAVKPGGPSKTPALDQYTIDLTARAAAGHIDPVLGRDEEIRQVIDILTRRRQNNPILTGEAGVGKTAVVEGFARRIALDDVPDILKGVSILSLDLALLQAGAGVKGEFENRLKSVINEVKSSPKPIIVFIDEAHTMIGAGGQAGSGDAANLLKPALARGEMRTIAATTWAEYKKYIEEDPALARRFQVVKVEEPNEKIGIEMIRGLADTLEKHHKVRILNEAVVEAVRLSNRYIQGRQLPDKAVSLLDTACAKVALGLSSKPAAVEDLQRRIEQLQVGIRILEREALSGIDHAEAVAELQQELAKSRESLEKIETKWSSEKEFVTKILDLRNQLEGVNGQPDANAGAAAPALSQDDKAKLKTSLDELSIQLREIQGEQPLVHVCVNDQAVADVVSSWTGIPVGRMVSNEIQSILNLKDLMEERVVGQTHALDKIAQSIRTSRAKLTDPSRPIGVFMLAGPSGTGKTETAITLAELLYGGEQNVITINMSEYKDEHRVSSLMGAAPGLVGSDKGGVLTEAVRRKPYSVVLLDELEKAHSGVQEVFYQVFDKGILYDNYGRPSNFKNSVILMTSNAGTDLIMKLCADPETRPDPEGLREALHAELLKTFKPAFLGRCTIIPFYPLSDEVMRKIIELKLSKIVRRVRENYRATLSCSPAVVQSILDRCQEVASGARNVDHILTGSMLPQLSAEFLSRMAEGKTISSVQVDIGGDGEFVYAIA